MIGRVAGIVGLAALCAASLAAEAQTKLRIGIVTALTGPWAAPGKFQMNGFNLAVEDVNRDGGVTIGGRRLSVELVVYDTRCNTAEASSAVQRLATVDEVPVILGELCTPAALAQAPLAQENEIPIIFTVPGSPTITDAKRPYVFRVNPNQAMTTEGLAKFVVDRDMQPLAFLAWNNDSGRVGVRLMRDYLPAGFAVPYVGYFNNGDVDFRSHIVNFRRENVRAVMLLMDEEPGSLAIRQIREAGLDVKVIGTLAMGSNRFLDRLDAQRLSGMIQYNSFPPKSDLPRIKGFSDRYEAKFKEEAHGWAANSYDALIVAVEAMKRAGTITDRARIRAEIAKTDHLGVSGRITFRPDGQADTPVYVTEWCADGTRKIVYPEEAVAGCGKG